MILAAFAAARRRSQAERADGASRSGAPYLQNGQHPVDPTFVAAAAPVVNSPISIAARPRNRAFIVHPLD